MHWLVLFFLSKQLLAIEVFDTGMPPKAQFPETIDGKIYYSIRQPAEYYARNKPEAIQRCILVHGHGVTQRHVALMTAKPDAQNRPLLNALRRAVDPMDIFANVMYGEYFLRGLTAKACNETIILFRETAQTSIAELTLQTEKFLDEVGCVDRLNKGKNICAIYGHSKGGAVVSHIARRCVEKSGSSQKVCENLAGIYSAAGVIRGVMAPALILGAKILGESLNFQDAFELGINILLSQTPQIAGIDTSGDYISGETNPVWLDLSVAAPLEDDQPIWFAERDAVIDHRGWFKGKYSASAGRFSFDENRPDRTIGYGTIPAPEAISVASALQVQLFENFSLVSTVLHTSRMKRYFETGMPAYKEWIPARYDTSFLKDLSWKKFQVSDGLVEPEAALSLCERSKRAKSPAIGSCEILENIHHLAMSGGAKEAADHAIKAFEEM